MGRKIRYYRNETTDPRLERGKLYTMHELAKLVKQSPTTIEYDMIFSKFTEEKQ
jgi:hypothetical protein